jgi:NADP-dependent aldehyde dehydrogenase
MLNRGIHAAYTNAVNARSERRGVAVMERQASGAESGAYEAGAALFAVDSKTFLDDRELHEEVFGPATLVVRCADRAEMFAVARAMEGHLTATVHGSDDDVREFGELVAILETRVGRIIWNGYPTGVEVCHAMVHGGPFPATSDSKATSVGSRAIFRFARPVCYQDCPEAAMPLELRNANLLGVMRMVDGILTRAAI